MSKRLAATPEEKADLKVCPFCGAEAFGTYSVVGPNVQIGCTNRACIVHPRTNYILPSEAIAAWNTRAPDERIARLEADRGAYAVERGK